MHAGPVMIYFGQELGVTSIGPKGFQGDDGRTTIFDYWVISTLSFVESFESLNMCDLLFQGIPEHQAWYNNGACDGGQLTNSQKALRSFYENLIQLIHKHKVLRSPSAKLADLQYANHSFYDTKKVYSFIRFLEQEEPLLFVLNFDYERSHEIELAIPSEVWSRIGLETTKTYRLRDVFIDGSLQLELRANENLRLTLPGNQVYVFRIEG